MGRLLGAAGRHALTRVTVIAMLTATAAIVAPTAAYATPIGCSAHITSNNTGVATCSGGTGFVRVVIECVDVNGTEDLEFGPAVPVGQTSEARCLSQRWSLQPEPWYTVSG